MIRAIGSKKAASDTAIAEKLHWLQLARTENVGPITFYNFIDYYGSAAKALEAIPGLAARGGRKKPLVIPPMDAVTREYEQLRKKGGDIITAADPDYPLPLGAIEDAPPVLSILGRRDLLARPSLAIVGARNASLNGRKLAEKLAEELGQAGHVITSGLARGIDTAAHEGALPTGTIAVVAGGIDIIYPKENTALYSHISENGLIIAENPLGTAPRAQDFPRRNRIVSGLSSGVVVVEATERSGSLITARLAAEQGRDVYAVPGHPLDPRAGGPNKLIRDGAALIRNADDILEGLNAFSGAPPAPDRQMRLLDSGSAPFHPEQADSRDLDEVRGMLMDHLSPAPCMIDDLIRQTGIPASLAHTALMELELAGRIQRLPGNRAMSLAA